MTVTMHRSPAAPGPMWQPGAVHAQARALLADAEKQPAAPDRFRLAHLAALRGTAALLAAVRDPEARRPRRPTSAWVLVDAMAPDFSEWSAYFARRARQRALADAGAPGAVSDAEAGEMLGAVRTYLALVAAAVAVGDEPEVLAPLCSPQFMRPPGWPAALAAAS